MANILIIEDDPLVRDALRELLSRAGHRVEAAADGANGVLAYRNQRPDLVILDRNLPVLSGSGVFSRIRARDPAARVIVLSGYAGQEDVAAYMDRGAAAFLSKGAGLAAVLEAVRDLAGPGAPRPGGAARREPAPAPYRPLALIADDEEPVRRLLRRALAGVGCRVLEAGDGEQAERLARENRPDIVMLDLQMPKKNGLLVLRELLPELPDAGFMIVTGYGEEETGLEALRLGALDYVSKPVNLDLLKTVLSAYLLQQDRSACLSGAAPPA